MSCVLCGVSPKTVFSFLHLFWRLSLTLGQVSPYYLRQFLWFTLQLRFNWSDTNCAILDWLIDDSRIRAFGWGYHKNIDLKQETRWSRNTCSESFLCFQLWICTASRCQNLENTGYVDLVNRNPSIGAANINMCTNIQTNGGGKILPQKEHERATRTTSVIVKALRTTR